MDEEEILFDDGTETQDGENEKENQGEDGEGDRATEDGGEHLRRSRGGAGLVKPHSLTPANSSSSSSSSSTSSLSSSSSSAVISPLSGDIPPFQSEREKRLFLEILAVAQRDTQLPHSSSQPPLISSQPSPPSPLSSPPSSSSASSSSSVPSVPSSSTVKAGGFPSSQALGWVSSSPSYKGMDLLFLEDKMLTFSYSLPLLSLPR